LGGGACHEARLGGQDARRAVEQGRLDGPGDDREHGAPLGARKCASWTRPEFVKDPHISSRSILVSVRRPGGTTRPTIPRSVSIVPHCWTCIAAVTRPCASQNVMNSPAAMSPRTTTSSSGPELPTYSIPSSNWSVKKNGSQS